MKDQTFMPIGATRAFAGHFDGAGYTISNFQLDDTSYQYQGLFGQVVGRSASSHA